MTDARLCEPPQTGALLYDISVIIPVLNEGDHLADLLSSLSIAAIEVLVVDGGSEDDTVSLARQFEFCRVIETRAGRAHQMNEGAQAARGEVLLFLHADSSLPAKFYEIISDEFLPSDNAWGRFDVRLSGRQAIFRVIEWMMNHRSRLTGICTGDQGMFVRRSVYDQVRGFDNIALMEDINLSRKLKRHSPPYCVTQPLTTSSRRWEQHGVLRTILLMWRLRLLYFLGAEVSSLARSYTNQR